MRLAAWKAVFVCGFAGSSWSSVRVSHPSKHILGLVHLVLSWRCVLHLWSLFEKEVETNKSYSLTVFRNWTPPFGSVRSPSWHKFTHSSLCGSAISFAVEPTIILSLHGPFLSQFLGTRGIMLDLQKSIASKFDIHIINAVYTVEENVGKVVKATIGALHEDV